MQTVKVRTNVPEKIVLLKCNMESLTQLNSKTIEMEWLGVKDVEI
jgi:hypothetical protein